MAPSSSPRHPLRRSLASFPASTLEPKWMGNKTRRIIIILRSYDCHRDPTPSLPPTRPPTAAHSPTVAPPCPLFSPHSPQSTLILMFYVATRSDGPTPAWLLVSEGSSHQSIRSVERSVRWPMHEPDLLNVIICWLTVSLSPLHL